MTPKGAGDVAMAGEPLHASETEQPVHAGALALEGVGLQVGGRQLLEDVTFVVPASGVTSLIGPSGSGKSSLLRAMNRLWDGVPGTRLTGRILLRGTDIYGRGVDPHWVRSRVGMVFQRPTPFPRSIYDNIALPLRVAGCPPRFVPERVERALTQAVLWGDVAHRLKDPAVTLSGGQQQRLAIARALAVEPDVLLLDEPASALDPRSRAAIDGLIQNLAATLAVVLVTHHLEEARRVSAMTGVLLGGRLAAFAKTAELFSNPPPGPVGQYLSDPTDVSAP